MANNNTDPATWSAASFSPDPAADIDTLRDFLIEAALQRLLPIPAPDRVKIAPTVADIALAGIEQARAAGLLDDDNGTSWTPKFREIIARILAEMLDSRNARLLAQCFDYSFGLGLQMGVSEQYIANEHGMTKSNVSKLCVGICERYNIPPSRGMRSPATRETYSRRQKGRRAKPSSEPWKFKTILTNAISILPNAA